MPNPNIILSDEERQVKNRVEVYLFASLGRYAPGQPEYYASLALRLGLDALERGNMGVGAVLVVVDEQAYIREYHAEGAMQTGLGVVDHAEIRAMLAYKQGRAPDKIYKRDLNAHTRALPAGVSIYASLEPCPMCVCAMSSIGVTHSISTALDGDCIIADGRVIGSTGAANAIGAKAALQPQVWQDIQKGIGLTFTQLETKDLNLQRLSLQLFAVRRARLDRAMAEQSSIVDEVPEI